MEELLTFENALALLTLTGLEIVLGIDNIIFIAILAGRLPVEQRDRARQLGLMLAVVSRISLLMCLGWIVSLKANLMTLAGHPFSGKDLVLLGGGLFLIYKTVKEIHHKVQAKEESSRSNGVQTTLGQMLIQVMIIDLVFSLDSVITAVGMASHLPIMILAVLLSVAVMMIFSGAVVRFVEEHPAIKILALSFLLMIGVLLVAEAFHREIPKGYIYFSMFFALAVEALNMRYERNVAKLDSRAEQPEN